MGLLSGLLGYRYLLVPVSTEFPYTVFFYRAEHYKTWSDAQARLEPLKEYVALLDSQDITKMKIMVFTAQEG